MSHPKNSLSNQKSTAAGHPTIDASKVHSTANQNRRGVQFLREGQIEKAVAILRSLVIPAGCIWTRPEVPNLIKRNFATALLMAGHPSGCLELLAEMLDDANPRVQQLRAEIKRWEKTLSFIEWVNWRTGWIEPLNRPVTLEIIPGELEEDALRTQTDPVTSASSHLSTSV